MHSPLRAGTLAASLLLGAAIVIPATTNAVAQDDVSISFGVFHDRLGNYGDWVYSDRWGEVWIPDVSEDFHPYYTNGHWVYTDYYGWMWVSDYPWGDITFHYGRWVDDPDAGWMWIPGFVWSPAWVVWRSNGDYAGWMPMPPDEQFLSGASFGISAGAISFGINFGDTSGFFGYSRWYPGYDEDRFASNWVFVRKGRMADRNFRRYAAPRSQFRTLLHGTRDVTHFTVQNNYIVNRSISVSDVERASGHHIQPVQARTVIRNPQFITNVNTGRDIQKRTRSERPHGTGEQGSAPKPSASVVQSLSTTLRNPHMRNKQNLFTRQNVEQGNFGHGGNNNAGPNNAPNGTNGPGNEEHRGQHEQNGPNNNYNNNQPPTQTNGPGNEEHRGRHEENGPNTNNNNNNQPPPQNAPGSEVHHGVHEENGPNNQNNNVTPQNEPTPPNHMHEHENQQGGPGGTQQGGPQGTSEMPRGPHEREHHPAPGSENNQPNNSGNPPENNHGDHMQTENPHAVHDRNTPTMPSGQPTTQPDHGQQPNNAPPENGKHHENQGNNGQGDNGDNDKRHKHDDNGAPPQ